MIKNFYIHIPFCRQKCSYCNFSTIQNWNNEIHKKYFEVLKTEIKKYFEDKKNQEIKTIYFWWWTPSAIDADFIWEILKLFPQQKNFVEILLESNPEDLSEKKLQELKKIWITKISIWIQSFQEKFFDFFERKNYEAEKIITRAKNFFPNLSIDLIFWIPNQTEKDLQKDLEIIKKLKLQHISYYALDYKKNSKIEWKKEKWLDFETVKKFYFQIKNFLEEENFFQYEIYNFCKKSNDWKKFFWEEKNFNWHNKNFWEWEKYYWFWLSAVWSDWENVFVNTKNLKKYLELNWNKNKFQEIEKIVWMEKFFLDLQKIFHLTRWKKIEEIEKILSWEKNFWDKILNKILKSKFIEKKSSSKWEKFLRLNDEWMMEFWEFLEEIFD